MKKKLYRFRESRLSLLMLVLAPIVTFYLLEWYTHNPFETMQAVPQFLNIILFELTALLLFVLTGKLHLALMTETLFFCIYGLVNYFVLNFRSVPIQPWDLFSIKTAASVADNYQYVLDRQAILTLFGFLLLLVLESGCRYTLKHRSLRLRLPAAAVLCAFLTMFGLMFHSDELVEQKLRLYNKLFTPTTISYKNGTALAFIMELRYMAVEKPEGYDPGEAAAGLARISRSTIEPAEGSPKNRTVRTTQAAVSGAENGRLPNIIVIMDEAFSDPAVLGDFETNRDYMPFVHSLMEDGEDTRSGWLHVSVLGGNTANTEFEYLTGSSMAFLPGGSIPYQQYITKETPSLASWLAQLGYRTVAMHPYHASGWDRDQVYPLLGFQEALFLPDFKDAGMVRNYVSDQSDFEKIISVYEEKEEGQPLFLFNVTMQNHSSYTESFDNFHPDIQVEGKSSTALDNYLSLIHLTDQALEKLTEYFSRQEEPTLIVFFGDHQPTNSVVEPVLRQNKKSSSSLTGEEQADRYRVPFLIWANFDIEEESSICVSANYLGALTLQTAGLPLSDYMSYLLFLSEQVPVLTANHAQLSDGTFTNADEQKNLLHEYRCYQYYQLFDAADRSEETTGQPSEE